MTPIDWDSDQWGGHVHVASWAADAHDASEAVQP